MPVKHKSDGNTPNNSTVYNHYVCGQLAMESSHDLTWDPICMISKSKIFIELTPKNFFDCWNLSNDWFLDFNVECVFLVGDYPIWSLRRCGGLFCCQYPLAALWRIILWSISLGSFVEDYFVVNIPWQRCGELFWGKYPFVALWRIRK